MVAINVTQAQMSAYGFWATVSPGDTLVLQGSWANFHKALNVDFSANPVKIDASQTAGPVVNFYPTDVKGMTFTKGIFSGSAKTPTAPAGTGLRIDRGSHIKVLPGVVLTASGSGALDGNALMLTDVSDFSIDGAIVDRCHFGLILNRCTRGVISNNDIGNQGADGLDLFGCQDIWVHHNQWHQNAHDPNDGTHPDLCQIDTDSTGRRSERITLEDNWGSSTDTQGFYLGNYTETGGAGSLDIVVRRNDLTVGAVRGISFSEAMTNTSEIHKFIDPTTGQVYWIDPTGVRHNAAPHVGLVIEDNRVNTAPGTQWQASILYNNAPAVRDSNNYVGAYTSPSGRVYASKGTPPIPALDKVAFTAAMQVARAEALKAGRADLVADIDGTIAKA